MGKWTLLCPALSFLTLLILSPASASSSVLDHRRREDPPLPPEDGSGPDDEDLSDLFADVTESDVTPFRCYRCIGVKEQSGCNLTALRQSPLDHVTQCDGHCLNISTADSTVFDCTDSVPANQARCFEKDDMKMCVCSTDLCNGYFDVRENDAKDIDAKDNDKENDIKVIDVKENDVKGHDVKGHDVKENDVRGHDVKENDAKDNDVIELPAPQNELFLPPRREDNMTLLETLMRQSHHSQRNDTYIDAAAISGGGFVNYRFNVYLPWELFIVIFYGLHMCQ